MGTEIATAVFLANVCVTAKCGVYPNTKMQPNCEYCKLYATNGTEINIYYTLYELDLNLRQAFGWLFRIAD